MGLLQQLEEDFEKRIWTKTDDAYLDYPYDNLVPMIDYSDLSWYAFQRQKLQLDSSFACLGENGIGKSMLALGLMKKVKCEQDPTWNLKDATNVIYAHQSHRDFINAVNTRKNDTILIDEAQTIFGAKDHMTTEQKVSYNFIETARKKSNAIIYCTKNYGGLNYSLRSGKLSVIIQIIDRDDMEDEKAQAFVFMASAIMQSEDRFGLEFLQYAKGWEEWKIMAERCWSFRGIMAIPDINKILSKDEIKIYDDAKDEGIELLAKKSIARMDAKEQMQEMRTEMYKRRMEAWKNPKRSKKDMLEEEKETKSLNYLKSRGVI